MLLGGDQAASQGKHWWIGTGVRWSGKLISMAGSRLLGDANGENRWGVLGRSKPNLEAGIQRLVDLVGSDTQVAPRFQ